MSWVSEALSALALGERVSIRPIGGSMRGRIESGELVTLAPVPPESFQLDDVVFVRWKGNYLLHLVRDIEEDRVLIGNALGKTNGWIPRGDVLGKVVPTTQGEQNG